jgi:glycosyltransferase involved in cell wall biosynthesis/GT2 family glycosyltransferase
VSDGRLPILYLAPWVDFGGSDKGTIDWFRWLDRSRFAPSLITTQPSTNARLSEVVPFAEEVWPLPDLMVGSRFAEFIVDFIASREVGVVHVMNSRIGFDLLPDIHALERPPRIVVQLHVEEPTRDGYVRYATTRNGNLVDVFSVSSEHLAEVVWGYGIPRDRIAVIHTGVDGEREFCPELVTPQPGLSPELVHILYPGRLVEQKDPLMMVEVARELDARGLAFRIHVVGTGDLEGVVRERVCAHHLEHRVAFEPPTRELARWYRAADLLLMTSRFEGVPYVVYEALAMGVPAVVPALPGNVELIDGVGGTLVGRHDRARAYADALEPLVSDRDLRVRVGKAGRARVLDRFSLRQMADRHGELYDRLGEVGPPRDFGPEVDPSTQISLASRPSTGTPLVSVVTPCFNHGRWLRECVAAIRAQTYPELEMIVCDDASTDLETTSYLEELALEPDIRLKRLPQNSGPSAARNRAIEHATGRYILPVDADNLLLPDAVERLVAQLQGAGERVGYIYQGLQFFGNREDYFEPPAFNAWLLARQNFVDTCALIDRQVFDAGLRYPEDIVFGHEDWDFFLTLASHGIVGEPARAKTLRYRKHGFSRSDRVEWSHSDFHRNLAARHPTMFAAPLQARGNNPQVRLKARWAPSLTVIALAPVALDSPAWETVLRCVRAQWLRDFELYAATDREPPPARDMPPLRTLPLRLTRRPAEALVYALERSGARNIVVTAGTGAEMLGDPGCLERIVRLLEQSASAHVVGFGDAGGGGRHPFALVPGDDPRVELHSLAWSRRHEALREPPVLLDDGDPVGGLGRWFQLRRVHVEWRHMPARSVGASQPGRRFAPVAVPGRPRADAAERAARLDAEPALPGLRTPIPRWAALRTWVPANTAPLVRHRRLDREEWVVNTSFEPPVGCLAEHYLGVVQMFSFEGTARIVKDGEQGYAALERGSEPDSDEMARTLGYADQVAFPLLEPLLLCRHAATGASVLVCGDEDPLRTLVESPPLAVLGWIDRLPVNPRVVPAAAETTAWLRGLVRTVDRAARRHRVRLGAVPSRAGDAWELGALLDRDPGDGVPAWVDAEGRLHTRDYAPTRYPFDAGRTLRWVAAPASWRRFGRRPVPRARGIARRSLDAVRYTLERPGLAAVPPPGEPQGWLLAEAGPDRIPIFSAMHAVTADQLVTRDPSEARELGYDSIRILGYALGLAPVTGTLARPTTAVPWGSRFGEGLTRAEDPYPDDT